MSLPGGCLALHDSLYKFPSPLITAPESCATCMKVVTPPIGWVGRRKETPPHSHRRADIRLVRAAGRREDARGYVPTLKVIVRGASAKSSRGGP